jgi:cytochrome c oxidase assembly protein subunit 11
MPTVEPVPVDLKRRHRRVAVAAVAVAVAMVGLTYASVPLYSMFCQVTGYGGTTQRASKAPSTVIDREVTVHFDSNVAPGLNWTFEPVVPSMTVKVGENGLAFFRATNRSDHPVTGTATFNVTPEQLGSYFNKLQCFCFTEQRLEPGETIEMPVSFFIDPAVEKDELARAISHVTLSYTFYATETRVGAAPASPTSVKAAGGAKGKGS